MLLVVRNVVFTVFVPGTVAVVVPLLIGSASGSTTEPNSYLGWLVIAGGVALYAWCLWNFVTVGRGTPGPWDPTERVIAAGPYLWVRNPMYIAVLAVILGEAWLLMSLALVVYAIVVAAVVHTFVVVYEEPTLTEQFGESYTDYRSKVSRWI